MAAGLFAMGALLIGIMGLLSYAILWYHGQQVQTQARLELQRQEEERGLATEVPGHPRQLRCWDVPTQTSRDVTPATRRANPDASQELSDAFPRAFSRSRSDEEGFAWGEKGSVATLRGSQSWKTRGASCMGKAQAGPSCPSMPGG